MKNLYLLFLAALLALGSSCSRDRSGINDETDGQVEFRITPSLLSDLQTKGNSAYGGSHNVDPAQHTLRYVCEVWTQEATPRLAYRAIKTVGEFSQKVEFSARLLQRKYDFVFWADFVAPNTQTDKYYKTDNPQGLKDVQMLAPYGVTNEAKDAYFASMELDLSQQGQAVTGVLLRRPFAKIRIVASDEPDSGLGEAPQWLAIHYAKTSLPAGFNALTGQVTDRTIDVNQTYWSKAERISSFSIGTADYGPCYLLGYDYVFASNTNNSLAFNVKVYSDEARSDKIGERDISSIPIERNQLTTVIGNLYTVEGKISVLVTDPFDKEEGVPVQSLDVRNIDAVNQALVHAPTTVGELKVNVTQPVSGATNQIVIPDAVMADNTPTVSLRFADVSPSTTITITDQTPSTPSTNYDGQLHVTVPDGMSLSNLRVNASKAHVVVYGSYGQVRAHTAPTTFVVPKGSVVAHLMVAGGNVEVHGTVATIEVIAENTERGVVRRLPSGTIGTFDSKGSYTVEEDFVAVSTTAELRAALAASTPRIALSEGVFELNSALTITYPVMLYGQGGNNTIVKSTAAAEPAMLISVATGHNATFDGIGFVGQKKHSNAGCLLFGTTANPNSSGVAITVNNCKFSDFTKNAITVKGGTATVSNNQISCGYLVVAASNGIQIDNGCVAQVLGNTVDGYRVGHPSWSATGLAVLRGGNAQKVAGNTFVNCQTAIYKETYYDASTDQTHLDASAERNNNFTVCSWNVFRTSPAHLCPASTLVVTSRSAGGYSLADGTFQYAPAGQCFTTIAAAVTAAPAGGVTDIRLDTGTWTQPTIGVAKNINFIGTGRDKTVLVAASGNVIQVTAANAKVSFQRMHIQGTHTNTGIGFSANDMSVRLEQVKVSACKYGLYFSDNGRVADLTLEECLFDANDVIGAYIGKAVTVAHINNSVFSNNGNVNEVSVNGIQKVGLQFCDWEGQQQQITITNTQFLNNANSPSSIENRAMTIYTVLATQQAEPILTLSGCVVSNNASSGGITPAVSSAIKIFNATQVGNTAKVSNSSFVGNAIDLSFYRVADQVVNCGNSLVVERR